MLTQGRPFIGLAEQPLALQMRDDAFDELGERTGQIRRRYHETVAAFPQEQVGQLIGDLCAGAHQLRHAYTAGEDPPQLLEGGVRALHQQLFSGGWAISANVADNGNGDRSTLSCDARVTSPSSGRANALCRSRLARASASVPPMKGMTAVSTLQLSASRPCCTTCALTYSRNARMACR